MEKNEIDELREAIDSALTGVKIWRNRCVEMCSLHPGANNEQYLPDYDKNIGTLQEMAELADDLIIEED